MISLINLIIMIIRWCQFDYLPHIKLDEPFIPGKSCFNGEACHVRTVDHLVILGN